MAASIRRSPSTLRIASSISPSCIAAKKLRPLPLGDAAALKQGQPLVALGHPRGLKHSVVAGVLSGRRAIEGVEMLQLAVPIEQGNSGGPVLDMTGRVVGVVSMKSQVTPNLGFAVPARRGSRSSSTAPTPCR